MVLLHDEIKTIQSFCVFLKKKQQTGFFSTVVLLSMILVDCVVNSRCVNYKTTAMEIDH